MAFLDKIKKGWLKNGEVHVIAKRDRHYKILPDGRRYLVNLEKIYQFNGADEPEEMKVFKGSCPDCGTSLIYPGGIPTCPVCGFEYSGPVFQKYKRLTRAEREEREIIKREIFEDVRGNL